MDYEACLSLKKEAFNVDEAASVIAVLKRKITMLGAVNPNAVEEYAEEKAHYDEMVTQRDDLQKAIEDLTVALDEIRGEMLKQFDEGFNEINENFKITFKELFGGRQGGIGSSITSRARTPSMRAWKSWLVLRARN